MMAVRAGGLTAAPAFLALAPLKGEAPSSAIGTSRTGKSGFTPREVLSPPVRARSSRVSSYEVTRRIDSLEALRSRREAPEGRRDRDDDRRLQSYGYRSRPADRHRAGTHGHRRRQSLRLSDLRQGGDGAAQYL